MSRNTLTVDVPPAAVFDVLADPRFFANWVVGASRTRRVEGRWPEPGAVLHHTQLMVIDDTTTVVACEPPHRLAVIARARPLAVTEVEITLEPEGGATRIVMVERLTGGLAAAVRSRPGDALMRLRNREAVRRLGWLAEIGRHLAVSAAQPSH